ncbi:MAG: hypothetical protein WCK28_08295 [Burkholderiales bacterium]|jgi:hypothetical protein
MSYPDVPSAADPADATVTGPRLEALRYTLDGGVEHHVAQLEGEERIVATLRIEPARSVPLRELQRLGVRTLPDAEGARVGIAADDDVAGRAGFVLLTAVALHTRRASPDDAWWIAECPAALRDTARALGWISIPAGPDAAPDTQAILLPTDDIAHLAAIGSPLAGLPFAEHADPARAEAVREAFGLPTAPAGARRAAAG